MRSTSGYGWDSAEFLIMYRLRIAVSSRQSAMRTGVVYGVTFQFQPRIKQMAADVQLIEKNVKQLY